MRKVLYVPLDDRDCNYQFPWLLSQMTEGLELLRPPYEWMGFLKKPADREKIWEWLFEQAGECDYAIPFGRYTCLWKYYRFENSYVQYGRMQGNYGSFPSAEKAEPSAAYSCV